MSIIIESIAGTGVGGYNGDDQVAEDAQLNGPCGIALDSNGQVYIADTENHRIRKIDLNGIISTIAGTGQKGYNGDHQLAINAQLNYPEGITVGHNGKVYIADTRNHRIRLIDLNGRISTIAGTDQQGDSHLITNEKLSYPQGVAVDTNGQVYITDTTNSRIRKIGVNGLKLTIAGFDPNSRRGYQPHGKNNRLNYPCGITVDLNGQVYVAERGYDRILKIHSNNFISTIAGTGIGGYNGDNQLAINIQLSNPHGIALDHNNQVYIADTYNGRVRKIDQNGIISNIAGIGVHGYSGDGQLAVNARLNRPTGIAVDANGKVYIADSRNHRIRLISRRVNPKKSPLKKYEERDLIKGTNLVAHLPSVELMSPLLYGRILTHSKVLISLDKEQQEIVQHLIDQLIYTNEKEEEWDTLYDPIVLLSVLVEIGSDRFVRLTNNALKRFKSMDKWYRALEKIEKYEKQMERFSQVAADQLINYCLYHLSKTEKSGGTTLTEEHSKLFNNYAEKTTLRIVGLKEAPIISLNEYQQQEEETPHGPFSTLFNNEDSADIVIRINERKFYCHRTILASSSPYFEILFQGKFKDSNENEYVVDTDQYSGELHEMVLRYCYGIHKCDGEIDYCSMLECSTFYGVESLSEWCSSKLVINKDNCLEMIHRFSTLSIPRLYNKLIQVALLHIDIIFGKEENWDLVPNLFMKDLVYRYYNKQKKMQN